ncbi:MAG: YqaE/Pmp3 family membrane protein [Deltaproteobacteria bacterium]|jgi:uncharacterized membrane protein YqaE (UPF0057 family)
MDLLRIFLCVVFPPLGVFLRVGFHMHFLISCVLTLLGYVPGLVHGIWVFVQAEEMNRLRARAW